MIQLLNVWCNETLLRRKCQGEMLLLATRPLNTEEPELVEAFLAGALLVLLTKLKLNQRITGFQRNSHLTGSVEQSLCLGRQFTSKMFDSIKKRQD